MSLLLLLLACGPSPTPAREDAHAHHHAEAEPAAEAQRGASVYELDVALVDQTGQAAPLDAWRGHPVLISMVYTSCTAVCPVIVADMQRVEADLDPAYRADLRYLLVSLDPARDTPEQLEALARRHALDPARWKVVVGDPSDTREIAAVLGIRYRALPSGELNHSSVITLLDGEGRLDTRVEGLGKPTEGFTARVRALRDQAS